MGAVLCHTFALSDFIYFPGATISNERVISSYEEDIDVCNLTEEAPNIATSVRLSFSGNKLSNTVLNRMKRNWWIIEQTVVVHKTVPSTYFGAIQLPGIYAGLQQLPDNECDHRKSNGKKNSKSSWPNNHFFQKIIVKL